MKKILIIEDDNALHGLIEAILSENYQTASAYSGTEGLLLLSVDSFDLILLDMMLPGMSGEELLLKIRETSSVPVIILTAITDKKIVTTSLLNGADDYMTKPFDVDELLARISVQLRKSQPDTLVNQQIYKNIELDLSTFQIKTKQKIIDLSKKEAEIFNLLIKHPKKVYTKEDLYTQVWQEAYYGDENTINVHVSNLRKKLAQLDDSETYIDTVWGIGIKLAN